MCFTLVCNTAGWGHWDEHHWELVGKYCQCTDSRSKKHRHYGKLVQENSLGEPLSPRRVDIPPLIPTTFAGLDHGDVSIYWDTDSTSSVVVIVLVYTRAQWTLDISYLC